MVNSEIEIDNNDFMRLEKVIKHSISMLDFVAAFDACNQSICYVESHLKLRKKLKQEPVYPPLLCVDVTCEYAPVFFETKLIRNYHNCLSSSRVLKKNYSEQIEKLEQAELKVEVARRAWWHVADNQKSPISGLSGSSGDTKLTKKIIDHWRECGILVTVKKGLSFKTNLDEKVDLMCPECGTRGQARKRKLLQPISCPQCKKIAYFHLVT